MATRSAKLYQGEDMLPVIDYTDLVIWEESEFGTRAHNGEGSASNVVIRDPLGEQGSAASLPSGLTMKSLASKNLFVIEVDNDIMFRGRVGIKNYSRDGQQTERYRQVDVSLHDTHWDLDHIFVHQYSRPQETDVARTQGIIASYLSGSPRETTVLNGSNYISASNPVMLPAQVYNRTSPLGMLREVGVSANKQFFITADTIGGGSLFWDGNDSAAYACAFTISDRPDEVAANPGTYFPPIWNVGPASSEDGSEQIDEVRYFYGSDDDSYVTVHSDIVHTQYGHASVTIFDDTAETASVALVRAESILSHRRREDRTYNVTIGPLTDAQVVQIKHGMTINIKARAIPDADDAFQLMRIGQCRYTTPVAGTWFAHLQLGRPWKMSPYVTGGPLGPKPPTTGSAPVIQASGGGANYSNGGFLLIEPLAVAGNPTDMLVVFVVAHDGQTTTAVRWVPDTGVPSAFESFTLEETQLISGVQVTAWKLYAPSATVLTGRISIIQTGGNRATSGSYFYLSGVTSATILSSGSTNVGAGVSTTLAGVDSGYLVLDAAGWQATHTAVLTAAPGADQTQTYQDGTTGGFGDPDAVLASSSQLGSAGGEMSWSTIPGSAAYVGAAHAVLGILGTAGSTTTPVDGTGTGDVGDDADTYAPIDHAHEHGSITTGGPYHMAEDVSITDAGAYFTGTDVEAALQELGAAGPGAGLPWFDVTAYGAVGDGTTDDTAAINSAIAAYNAAGGGVLYFPAGHYQTTGALTSITAGGLILGDGHAHRDGTTQAASRIDCSSATLSLFTIASHAVTMRGLALVNDAGSTPSAGAGITVTSGGHARYENLSVSGFFVGLDVQDGEHWAMSGCYVHNTVSHGLLLAHTDLVDGGDWSISDTWITAAARTAAGADALRCVSGGGGKITNLKVNTDNVSFRYTHGIHVALASVQTSVLLAASNSIENVWGDAIRIATTGTGRFGSVAISGLQAGLHGNNSGFAVNLIAASPGGYGAAGGIGIVTIDGIAGFTDGTARALISLTNTDRVTIGDLAYQGFNARYTSSGDTNTTDGGSLSGAAGGDLSGTYPNPTVVDDSHDHTAATLPSTPGLLTVDAGTPTYDDSGADVVITLASQWGYDADGPYFNSAGVTTGEEAILAFDPVTGEMAIFPYEV